MSFSAVVWAWEQEVDAAELLVLLTLADTANENGCLFASYTYIAKRCRRSERHVRSIVGSLDGRLLRSEERPGRTDVIYLLIPEEFSVRKRGASFRGDQEAGKRGRPRKRSEIHDDDPGNPALKLVTQIADEPKKEPLNEPVSLFTRDDFALWYDEYPRHDARADAEKAWKKVPIALGRQKLTFAALMERTRIFRASVVGVEKKYIPLPATWLNGERWNDEITLGEPTNGHRREPTDRIQQRTATVFGPMAAGAQEALNRRRGRWGV